MSNFHKSVVITPKVHKVFNGTAFYTYTIFLQLVWKPLELFHSKFGIRLFGLDIDGTQYSRKQHMKKSEHVPLKNETKLQTFNVNFFLQEKHPQSLSSETTNGHMPILLNFTMVAMVVYFAISVMKSSISDVHCMHTCTSRDLCISNLTANFYITLI